MMSKEQREIIDNYYKKELKRILKDKEMPMADIIRKLGQMDKYFTVRLQLKRLVSQKFLKERRSFIKGKGNVTLMKIRQHS